MKKGGTVECGGWMVAVCRGPGAWLLPREMLWEALVSMDPLDAHGGWGE